MYAQARSPCQMTRQTCSQQLLVPAHPSVVDSAKIAPRYALRLPVPSPSLKEMLLHLSRQPSYAVLPQ
eukprot:4007319-Amphidinium_carterae.1